MQCPCVLLALLGLSSAAVVPSNERLSQFHAELGALEEYKENTVEHLKEIDQLDKKYDDIFHPKPASYNKSAVTFKKDINEINDKAGSAKFLFEGDLSLTEKQMRMIEAASLPGANRSRRQAMANQQTLWPKNTKGESVVSYVFGNGFPTAGRQWVRAAMDQLQKDTCARFVEDPNAKNRIEFVNRYSGGQGGCYSNVGMIGGGQHLSLEDNCFGFGTIQHELIHALGVLHVQSREDRDLYVTVDEKNIESEMEGNFKRESARDYLLHNIPYEFGSNMHYYSKDFSVNGDHVMKAKTPYGLIFQNQMGGRVPTNYDLVLMNKHLKCYERCGTTKSSCVNGEQDVNNCAACRCFIGWTGATCNTRIAVKETITTSAKPVSKMLIMQPFAEMKNGYKNEYYLVKNPTGGRVKIEIKQIGSVFSNFCAQTGLEVRYMKDQKYTGLQYCDFQIQHPPLISEGPEILLTQYSMGPQAFVEFTVTSV